MNSPSQGADLRWISADDPALTYQGAASLSAPDSRSVMPLRLPETNLSLHPQALVDVASIPSGVRIVFTTDSRHLAIDRRTAASSIGPCLSPIDLVIDDKPVGFDAGPLDGITRFPILDPGQKKVEIWLPHTGITRVRALGLDQDCGLWNSPATGPTWVAYGSSLTQSRFADSPLQTWPALIARELRLDLQNRGYAGQAHLDPLVAAEIRDAPADLITLCIGINIALTGSMIERSFRSAVAGFVATIRETHRYSPIVIIGPTWAGASESQPATPRILPSLLRRVLYSRPATRPHLGLHLGLIRTILAESAAILDEFYEGSTVFVDGTDLLGHNNESLLEDGLHYTAQGEHHVAKQMLPHIRAALETRQ